MKPHRIIITRDAVENDRECTIWQPNVDPHLHEGHWDAENPNGKYCTMDAVDFESGFGFLPDPGSKRGYTIVPDEAKE